MIMMADIGGVGIDNIKPYEPVFHFLKWCIMLESFLQLYAMSSHVMQWQQSMRVRLAE